MEGLWSLHSCDLRRYHRGMTAITRSSFDSAPEHRIHRVATQAEAYADASLEVGEGPNYWNIYASSIAAVTILFLLGVAIPSAMVYGNATGWALGAFCAFWGGPGFGVMAGGARVSTCNEKHGADH